MDLNLDERIAHLKTEISKDWKGAEKLAMDQLLDVLDDNVFRDSQGNSHPETTEAEKSQAKELYKRVSGKWNATHEHVDDWLATAGFAEKTADEARRNIKLFAEIFPIFEEVTQVALKDWVEEQLSQRSAATVKKRIGHVRGYWVFCFAKGNTLKDPSQILTDLFPTVRRTKAQVAKEIRGKRTHFTPADYHIFLKAKPNDTRLLDLIRLGAHTGCRIEELCSMSINDVKEDRFVINDAKTAAGWREIPIHKDIHKVVERLRKESDDGYLLWGLSSDQYGKRSPAIGHRFSRLKVGLGYGPQFVFHSFRKSLVRLMLESDVQEQHAALIVGHNLDTLTYGLYAGDISFAKKAEILNGITYGPEK